MSFEDTAESMAGILPVVAIGGMAMVMTDWMQAKMQPQQFPLVRKKKKDVYSREYTGQFGNFSNIGW